jgi:hypothetical protein
MRTTYRLLLPAICLIAAAICYLLSFQLVAGCFFAVGVVFEIVAWVMPRRRTQSRRAV